MRSQELPVIACSLDTAELTERSDTFRQLFADSLLSADRQESSVSLTFGADAHGRVVDLVAKESVCCPFFQMEVLKEEGTISLSIAAPTDAGPLLDDIYGAAVSALSDPGL